MGIGTSVVLLAAGAILYWAVDVDVPYVDDNVLGAILMVAGAIAAAAAAIMSTTRHQTGSGAGGGIVLIAAGAILYAAVDVDLPYVFDGALGMILMVAGVIAVIVTVIMHLQSSRSRQVVDHRYQTDSQPR
ncbi:MAG: hypothetical protein ACRDOY_10270 [Nocardioidaceae bacterium]